MTTSCESRADKARAFLGVIKDTLSRLNFQRVMEALQQYKTTDDFQALLTDIVDVFAKDSNTHYLLRGMDNDDSDLQFGVVSNLSF